MTAAFSLNPDDVVEVVNPKGRGGFVLICEHASNHVPTELGDLGLGPDALESHIAWDPGARAVAMHLSVALDAPLVASRVSRLVYDCNRPTHSDSAIPACSESTDIPGNAALTEIDRVRRAVEVYGPFRDRIAGVLDKAMARGIEPIVLTIHSFTPVFLGKRRELDVGILHDVDSRLADVLLVAAESEGLDFRRNEPYGPEDGVTHTLALHAVPRGLANVMIEMRNDLLTTPAAQQAFAKRLARIIKSAAESLAADMKKTG